MKIINSQKGAFVSGFFWRLFERFGAQCVTLLVSIILARILDPETYGAIALVTVLTAILQVFVDSGLGNALIQKKDADDLDFSSVFYFNVFLCILLYSTVYFSAPLIARFYKDLSLVPIIRVLSLVIIISGVKNVQHAYVARHMLFRRFFFSTLGGTIGAAIIGIFMALKGFGVWALVAQELFNKAIDTIVLWVTVKWRPKKQFSLTRLKGLLSFGWKLLVSRLIDKVYNELITLIIGRIYSKDDLAFFNRGKQLPGAFVTDINTSLDSVLFPVLSNQQDEVSRVRAMTRRTITVSTFFLMPIMMGLAVCAEPFVVVLLTEKWLPSVPFIRIFCFTYAFWPLHTANLNAIKSLGRSDIFLKQEIIKKIIGLLALIVTMRISVEAMAYSMIVTGIISLIINSFPNIKLLRYGFKQQFFDVFPQFGLSCVMGAIVFPFSQISAPSLVILAIQVPLGVAVYVLGSMWLQIESYEYVLNSIKTFLQKKKVNE